jgi:hypothetical protein
LFFFGDGRLSLFFFFPTASLSPLRLSTTSCFLAAAGNRDLSTSRAPFRWLTSEGRFLESERDLLGRLAAFTSRFSFLAVAFSADFFA